MTPAERVAKIEAEISGCASLFGVTSWERSFLTSIKNQQSLSVKQEDRLAVIEDKVFNP